MISLYIVIIVVYKVQELLLIKLFKNIVNKNLIFLDIVLMKNILFVLYEDFYFNSVLYVYYFVNNLVKLGFDCVVVVFKNKQIVLMVGKYLVNLY